MPKSLARWIRGFMLVSSAAVALYSMRYYAVLADHWPFIDAGIRGVISRVRWTALSHMLIAPIPLLVGPLQFLGSLRTRHRRLHRTLGRIYVATCLIAGIGGFATSFHASGGPVAGIGFGLLALCWVGVTLAAWQAAMKRQLEWHRLLMRLSYAMTFGAVTLRLQIPLGFALGYRSYPAMSVWLAYSAWIPNVVVVLLYSWWERRRRITGDSAASTVLSAATR
jgi:uncharacterized membrane protein